jgi:hypothetical protein
MSLPAIEGHLTITQYHHEHILLTWVCFLEHHSVVAGRSWRLHSQLTAHLNNTKISLKLEKSGAEIHTVKLNSKIQNSYEENEQNCSVEDIIIS